MKALVPIGIVVCLATTLLDASASSQRGVAVQFPSSGIRLNDVNSDWSETFDFVASREGNIYSYDCATFAPLPGRAIVKHIQLIFAAVNTSGETEAPLLPVDINIKRPPDMTKPLGGCRDHGYANGERGLWLVAWVNEVDFADGTSWNAPPRDQMTPYILDALRKATSL